MTSSVKLTHPIEVEGILTHVLDFRRANVGDMMKIDALTGDMPQTAKMIELLAGITPREVMQIDVADLPAIGEVLRGFFASPPTGAS